jgi:hypothetical protein
MRFCKILVLKQLDLPDIDSFAVLTAPVVSSASEMLSSVNEISLVTISKPGRD